MDDKLDVLIKSALQGASSEFPRLGSQELAERIERRLGSQEPTERIEQHSVARRHPHRRSELPSIAAAAAAVLLLAGLFAVRPAHRQDLVATGDEPVPSTTSWNEMSTEGLPSLDHISVAISGTTLIVAGTAPSSDAEGLRGKVLALPNGAESWTPLPAPPLERFDLVAAGDELVILGVPDAETSGLPVEWSVLGADARAWTPPVNVPSSPGWEARRSAIAGMGLNSGFEAAQLVWTGSHVIDTKYGVSIDPVKLTSLRLDAPPNIEEYSYLAAATPVWTGDSLVLTGWTTQPGLAWDQDGRGVREVPGLPASMAGDEILPTSATSVAGSVVLSSGLAKQGSRFAQLDADEVGWRPMAEPPGETDPLCGWELSHLDGHLIAQGCDLSMVDPPIGESPNGPAQLGDLWVKDDSGWQIIESTSPPFLCCGERHWTEADGNLVMVGHVGSALVPGRPEATLGSSDRLVVVSVSR